MIEETSLNRLIKDSGEEGLIAAIGDGVCIQDKNFRIHYQNEAHKKFLGDISGEYCYKAYKCRDHTCEECPVAMTLRDGNAHRLEMIAISGNKPLHFEITASPLRDAEGMIIGAISVFREITGRKRIEEESRREQLQVEELLQRKSAESLAVNERLQQEIIDRIKTEMQLRQEINLNRILLNNMPCKALLIRPGSRHIVAANETAVKAGAVAGKQCFATRAKLADPCPFCLAPKLWTSSKAQRLELEISGIVWDVHWLRVSDDLYLRYAFDITERKNLEKTLIETEERERRRIGQDLHDGIGQLLAGTAYKIRGLERKLEKSSPGELKDAEEISLLIGKAKEQVSRVSRGLSPVEMDKEGLMAALEELADNIENMFGVSSVFKCDKPVFVGNKTVVTQLYRIAQEAVTNAAKHGKPGKIEIRLTKKYGKISVVVKDDGIGISEICGDAKGMGLRIMRHRAGIINASLDVRRGATGGTVLTCICSDMFKDKG